jgi:hypothetical protein
MWEKKYTFVIVVLTVYFLRKILPYAFSLGLDFESLGHISFIYSIIKEYKLVPYMISQYVYSSYPLYHIFNFIYLNLAFNVNVSDIDHLYSIERTITLTVYEINLMLFIDVLLVGIMLFLISKTIKLSGKLTLFLLLFFSSDAIFWYTYDPQGYVSPFFFITFYLIIKGAVKQRSNELLLIIFIIALTMSHPLLDSSLLALFVGVLYVLYSVGERSNRFIRVKLMEIGLFLFVINFLWLLYNALPELKTYYDILTFSLKVSEITFYKITSQPSNIPVIFVLSRYVNISIFFSLAIYLLGCKGKLFIRKLLFKSRHFNIQDSILMFILIGGIFWLLFLTRGTAYLWTERIYLYVAFFILLLLLEIYRLKRKILSMILILYVVTGLLYPAGYVYFCPQYQRNNAQKSISVTRFFEDYSNFNPDTDLYVFYRQDKEGYPFMLFPKRGAFYGMKGMYEVDLEEFLRPTYQFYIFSKNYTKLFISYKSLETFIATQRMFPNSDKILDLGMQGIFIKTKP